MALKYIEGIQRWSGLSTDTKPGTAAVGSYLFETDSGKNYQWDGTTWNKIFPTIDQRSDGALVVVQRSQHEVREGDFWTGTYAETLATGSVSTILLETPGSAVSTIHMSILLETSAAGTAIFSEIPNATVGTVITPNNNSRIVAGSSGMISFTYDGAITTTGTILQNVAMGVLGGAMGNREADWLLQHSTRYLLKFTASAATNVAWNVFWVEEPA